MLTSSFQTPDLVNNCLVNNPPALPQYICFSFCCFQYIWSVWSSMQVYKQPQKNEDMEISQGNNKKDIFIFFTCSETQSTVELRWSVVGAGRIFLRFQETLRGDCLLETRPDMKLWLVSKFSWCVRSEGLGSPFNTSIVKPHLCKYKSREVTEALTDWSSSAFLPLSLCTSNCRSRGTGNSELALTTITISDGAYTSWATQLWTLCCHG